MPRGFRFKRLLGYWSNHGPWRRPAWGLTIAYADRRTGFALWVSSPWLALRLWLSINLTGKFYDPLERRFVDVFSCRWVGRC